MRLALIAALLTLVTRTVIGVEPPRAESRDGWVEVALSGTMLDDARVRQRAESGLTATLVILDRAASESSGAAWIAFRFEPWDEVFLVSVMHADGTRSAAKIDTIDELRDHVESQGLRVRRTSADGEDTLDLEVRLVPFSSEEQLDAREWFLETLGSTPKGSTSGGISSMEGVVDVLLATSIKARPVASWRWRVKVRLSGDSPR